MAIENTLINGSLRGSAPPVVLHIDEGGSEVGAGWLEGVGGVDVGEGIVQEGDGAGDRSRRIEEQDRLRAGVS